MVSFVEPRCDFGNFGSVGEPWRLAVSPVIPEDSFFGHSPKKMESAEPGSPMSKQATWTDIFSDIRPMSKQVLTQCSSDVVDKNGDFVDTGDVDADLHRLRVSAQASLQASPNSSSSAVAELSEPARYSSGASSSDQVNKAPADGEAQGEPVFLKPPMMAEVRYPGHARDWLGPDLTCEDTACGQASQTLAEKNQAKMIALVVRKLEEAIYRQEYAGVPAVPQQDAFYDPEQEWAASYTAYQVAQQQMAAMVNMPNMGQAAARKKGRGPAVPHEAVAAPMTRPADLDADAMTKFSPQVRSQFRKTKLCSFFKKNRCVLDRDCPFAHTSEELKLAPDLTKTKLCYNYFRQRCFDPKCNYAHGYGELRSTDDVYKTELCRWASQGWCKAGNHCRYAHAVGELRQG
mmetsp:Transcript_59508/g.129152  ORF Transcript_59508/g.129152 Transcript_59508/m.129152 type:complete len:403 (+) Transcript_59508:97-1305(+)